MQQTNTKRYRNIIALKLAIFSLLWTLSPAVAVPTETPIAPIENNSKDRSQEDVNNIVSYLVGILDTSEQAAVNSKFANVQMTTCKITVANDNIETNSKISVFLYQEQALADSLNEPYRQRFLEILPSDTPDTTESKSYKPNDLEKWIGFCGKTEAERVVTVADLGTYVCSVLLKRSAANYIQPLYVGETQAGGCPTNLRGATSISNTIYLFPDGMNTWDRGFDANGNRVWGAANEAYKFRKRKESQPR